MKKPVKILLWIVGVLAGLALILMFVVWPIMKKNTKKHSPEQHITFVHTVNDLELETVYSSPSKKGRVIFGELVPYGEVWRTGANEATTFTTNKDLTIDGKTLQAGTYTLWTIPDEASWEVIFNSKMYSWGVSFKNAQAARDPAHDALVTTANVSKNYTVAESFSISFTEDGDDTIMLFAWDDVVVAVKLEVQ